MIRPFVIAIISSVFDPAFASETPEAGRSYTHSAPIYGITSKMNEKYIRFFDVEANAGYQSISISEFTHSEGLHAVSRQVNPIQAEVEFTGKNKATTKSISFSV